MLVLRRKAGEAIVLNGVITIHVLAVEGERVKLGISAPPEVVIVRSELLENQGQAGSPSGGMPAAAPAPRETSRAFREHESGPSGAESDEGPTHSRNTGTQPAPHRYGTRARSTNEDVAPAPIGSGPLRYN